MSEEKPATTNQYEVIVITKGMVHSVLRYPKGMTLSETEKKFTEIAKLPPSTTPWDVKIFEWSNEEQRDGKAVSYVSQWTEEGKPVFKRFGNEPPVLQLQSRITDVDPWLVGLKKPKKKHSETIKKSDERMASYTPEKRADLDKQMDEFRPEKEKSTPPETPASPSTPQTAP